MPGAQWTLQRVRRESEYPRACILLTAAHLDLFNWIGKREKKPAELAARFGGRAQGWKIFLDALCARGLLRKRRRKYANSTFAARCLTGDAASFLPPAYDAWDDWSALATALRSGKRPRLQKPFASDLHKTRRLLIALDRDARRIAPLLITKLPLRRSRALLDVGGGLGAYSMAFCRRYPRLRATLIEHPRIAPLARRAIRQRGMACRVRVVGADFSRDPLPRGFDTVWLSNVLHARGTGENRALIGKLHRCLNPGGRLILRDVLADRDVTSREWAALFSVWLFLQTPRGRCYALDEVLAWLRGAGFSRVGKPFASSRLTFDPDVVLIAEKNK